MNIYKIIYIIKMFKLCIIAAIVDVILSSGNPPIFAYFTSNTIANIAENAPVGSTIYTLIATDDEADNLTYSKVSQTPNLPDFQLNTKTGEIYAPSGLDADNGVSSFDLQFDVSDGSKTVASPILTIRVIDVNDNKPTFGSSSKCFEISNYTETVQIKAHDKDATNVISYSILNDKNFVVDNNGVISAASELNKSFYTLKLQASDGTFSNTIRVYIAINMQNICSLFGDRKATRYIHCRFECNPKCIHKCSRD
jgi:hypothetical protein